MKFLFTNQKKKKKKPKPKLEDHFHQVLFQSTQLLVYYWRWRLIIMEGGTSWN